MCLPEDEIGYYENWQTMILREVKQEEINNHPVRQRMHGVRFISKIKGRGRKRKRPTVVTLIQYGSVDEINKRWRFWSGEDHSDKGRVPWDEWATEIFGSGFCQKIYDNSAVNPEEYLRYEFLKILHECGGKF